MSREPDPVDILRYRGRNGDEVEVPIQAPGGVLRFSLGRPGACAAVWRLFTGISEPDIYLAQRGDDSSKHSFHASGDWRHQYERAHAEKLGVARVLSRTRVPDADELRRTRVVQILTPSDDIVAGVSPVKDPGKVLWIKSAPPGMLNSVVIDKVSPGGTLVIEDRTTLIGAMLLADDSLVTVLHVTSPMRRGERERAANVRRILSESPPAGSPIPEGPGPHPDYRCEGAEHQDTPDGPLSIWDLKM